jgi:hypothetical protein
MNAQPVISPARIIAKEERGTIINGGQNVDLAIVIEISERQTTRGQRQREKRNAPCADVFERIAGAVKQDERFFITALAVQGRNEVVRIAVGEKQIQIPIVVVVKDWRGGCDESVFITPLRSAPTMAYPEKEIPSR